MIGEKLSVTTDREKIIRLLVIVPESWSVTKTAKFFNVTQNTVRQAREMQKENGILSSPVKYSREGVSAGMKQMIINFREGEVVSRMCP